MRGGDCNNWGGNCRTPVVSLTAPDQQLRCPGASLPRTGLCFPWPKADDKGMSGLGHVLKVFYLDVGPLGEIAVWILAALLIWLGYRHSRPDYTRPEHSDLSIRRPPES